MAKPRYFLLGPDFGFSDFAFRSSANSQSSTIALVLQFPDEVYVPDAPLLIRPYLQTALLCEKHLIEQDGAISLIRIVDRFTVPGTENTLPPTILTFTIAVMFKAGNFRGRAEIGIQPISPSKVEMPSINMTVQFEGDDERGVNLIGQVKLEILEEGLYWLIVTLEKEEYTRIPLRIVYQKQPTIQTS